MANYGINFRATSGYVTDGAGETYSLGETYPTTRGGLTFGFNTAGNSRDRNSGNDRRMAGMVQHSNSDGAARVFRLDLPSAGEWIIRAAFGDASNAQTHWVTFKDDTTTFASFSSVSSGANSFADAAGTVHTHANWPSSNASITHTFSSSTLRVEIGHPSGGGGDSTTIAHLYIEEVSTGADLEGDATATATATGALNIDKPLAGAAQGQATASGTLDPSVPGFSFDLDADCILGEIVGALTGIARETTGTDYIVRAYDVATGALVEESGTLTTNSNGRLPRWQDAGLDAATEYHLLFVRVADGAIGCKLMETS